MYPAFLDFKLSPMQALSVFCSRARLEKNNRCHYSGYNDVECVFVGFLRDNRKMLAKILPNVSFHPTSLPFFFLPIVIAREGQTIKNINAYYSELLFRTGPAYLLHLTQENRLD